MKVKDLKPGDLVAPKEGYIWIMGRYGKDLKKGFYVRPVTSGYQLSLRFLKISQFEPLGSVPALYIQKMNPAQRVKAGLDELGGSRIISVAGHVAPVIPSSWRDIEKLCGC